MNVVSDISANERLKHEVDQLGKSITAVAEESGIPRNTLYDLFKQGNSIKHNYLSDLYEKFGIDINYVITGSRNRTDSKVKEDIKNYSLRIDDDFTRIPYMRGIKTGSGYGLVDEGHSKHYIAFRHYFVETTLNAQAVDLLALRVGGNSMEPVLQDGDDILVDRARRKIMEGPAFLIRINDEVFVKYLTKLPGKHIKVWSENSNYEPFEVSGEDPDFEVIGQVVWHAHVSDYL